jgi:hypothetical protein
MMEAFTPFGVGSEYNCNRSGCFGGHFFVIGNAERSVMASGAPECYSISTPMRPPGRDGFVTWQLCS